MSVPRRRDGVIPSPHLLSVRRAVPADESAIDDVALGTQRVTMRIPWGELCRALRAPKPGAASGWREVPAERRTYDLFVAEAHGQLGCLWASVVEPPTVAQLCALIVHDDWPLQETLGAVLPPVRRALRERGVATLAFVGLERWLLDGLAANGFSHTDTVVTLQKADWTVPGPGNRQVVVRPAAEPDFCAILDIDQRAFEPLWRNTARALAEHLRVSPYFVVAELEDQVVGYEYASLTGRHGHLSRIAVCPQYHGRHVGVRLLAEALAFFRRARVFGVTVNTQRDNAQARRLYAWFGFRLLGEEAEVWTCAL